MQYMLENRRIKREKKKGARQERRKKERWSGSRGYSKDSPEKAN